MGFDKRIASIDDIFDEAKRNGTVKDLSNGEFKFNGKIPAFKCMDFWMGGVDNNGLPTITKKEDWRKYKNKQGLDFSNNPVSESILLIPDGREIVVSGGMTLKDYSQKLGTGGDILAILNSAESFFKNSMIVPNWKPRVFESLNPLKLEMETKFKFHYGAAGLYDAWEEVVKPIYALLNFFSIDTGPLKKAIMQNEASTLLPYPNESRFVYEQLQGARARIKAISTEGLNINQISDVNAALQSIIQAGAGSSARSSAYNNLWVSYGRFTFGPMQYSDIKFGFDMNAFDENGWPISGWFQIGGLESTRMATTAAMMSTIIKGI